MIGLSSDLYKRCRDVLSTCEEFESNERLRIVFLDARLAAYRNSLPQADNITSRVERCVDYLLPKRRRGEPVLPIFLEELRDRYPKDDSLHADLDQLAREVRSVLTPPIAQESQPPPSGKTKGKTNLNAAPAASQTTEASPAKSVFISYSHSLADQDWAEWVSYQLADIGYDTILSRSIPAGLDFIQEWHEGITKAEHIIALFSPDYLKTLSAQPGLTAALAQQYYGKKGMFLPIRIRECRLEGLLGPIVYLDFVPVSEESQAREMLLASLGGERDKPTRPPTFPDSEEKPPYPL